MPKKVKKFIDKKNAVSFHLVHRSQQDPLAADERAPQKVLLPVNPQKAEKKKQIEEQQKYGIYFDDDYNYLQHLRETNNQMEWEKVEKITATASVEKPKVNLPSSVFASGVEEDVGLLNKAAPESGLRLDLDPDIVAAMDDDFDFEDPENELEDNFIELANATTEEEYDAEFENSDIDSNFNEEDEERDEVGSLNGSQFSFNEEETKSRFTEYSMTSSVIRRNQQLSLLDERFEKMYATYDENEIGALDCEEIEGHVADNSNILLQYAEEFEKSKAREQLGVQDKSGRKLNEDLSSATESDEELVEMQLQENNKWDCQSIISTYSDIYNHPKVITEPERKTKIKINMRTGLPVDVLGANKLTAKALAKFDQDFIENNGPKSVTAESIISTLSTLSIRPKNESPQERRERKKLLKEYRKERRIEKKINTMAFKEEAKRQAKITINNRNNVQGNKLI